MKRTLFSILSLLALTACNGNSANNVQNSESDSTAKKEIVKNSVEDEDDECETQSYEIMDVQLRMQFDVEGAPNIVSFVKAIESVTGDLINAEDGEATLDKKNGYFSYFQEGGGSIHYDMAYWNRDNGSKMFIVSYHACEEVFAKNKKEKAEIVAHEDNEWFWYDCTVETKEGWGIRHDMGFIAYEYHPTKKKLIPMKQSPFNYDPQGEPVFYELPCQGKNIKVRVGLNGDYTYHSLIFNGYDFDYED